jgi:hypothetical protein
VVVTFEQRYVRGQVFLQSVITPWASFFPLEECLEIPSSSLSGVFCLDGGSEYDPYLGQSWEEEYSGGEQMLAM